MSEIVEVKTGGELAQAGATPSIESILYHAVASGTSADVMEKIVDLCRSVRADKAKEAFSVAMAEFKAKCPQIERRTENPQFMVMRDGQKVPRKFASTEDIGAQTKDLLSKCGLSYRWGDSAITGNMMTIPCIVRHVGGHEESSSSTVPIESSAGASPQQKYGIAEAYAMRYSLKKALGLTECDEDTDGNAPDNTGPTISQDQADEISILLAETGSDKGRFLKWAGVDSIADIPERRYAEIVASINAKRRPK